MTDLPLRIAVAGYAGAGKDTVVEYLVQKHGFARVAFADPLREFVAAVNPIIGFDNDVGIIRYNDALAKVGYNQAKFEYPEVRNILQKVGTEGARETFWDSFWVDIAMDRASKAGPRVAFSDCRFPNEAAAVSDVAGGFTVWVSRAGFAPVNTHVSDKSLEDWDFDLVIANDGEFEDLWEQVDDMVEAFESQVEQLRPDDSLDLG